MLRLGIIGCGRVTTMFHLKAIEEVEEVSVVAVADSDRARMESVKAKSGANRGYIEHRELLSDPEVEAVAINTPPRFHEEMIICSLKAGKHVLCEKPLASSVEGCLHIRRVQAETGLVVFPGHNYVFTPCLDRAQELIESGSVGEVRGVSVKFGNNLRGYRSKTDFRLKKEFGIVEDVLPHILSVTRNIAGVAETIEEVRAWRESYDVVDNMSLLLRTDRGTKLDCFMSWTKLVPSFKVEASGISGRVEMDLIRSPFVVTLETDGMIRKIGEKKGLRLYLDLLQFKHPSFQSQYRHLCRLVEGLERPRMTLDDEIDMIRVMEGVFKHLSETDIS